MCQECGFRHSNYHTYNCPDCGSEPIDDEPYCEVEECTKDLECGDCPHLKIEKGTLIKATEPEYCYGTAIMYGGNPCDWVETHKCWRCGTVYEFSNSNY